MRMMNSKMNMPQIMNIMREFEKQNEKMEMTSDMMGDAVDDAMGVSVCFVLVRVFACVLFMFYSSVPNCVFSLCSHAVSALKAMHSAKKHTIQQLCHSLPAASSC